MTTETKRDLQADLALCEAATAGPWYASGDDERPVVADRESVITARGSELAFVGISCEDEEFIAESREGWAHAIRRAIAAEEKWAQLRDVVVTNATGDLGENINDWDIMLNHMNEIDAEVSADAAR